MFDERCCVKIFTWIAWVTTMCSVNTAQDIWIQQRTQCCRPCPREPSLWTCQSRDSDLIHPREHLPWIVLKSPQTQHVWNRTQPVSHIHGVTWFPHSLGLEITLSRQWVCIVPYYWYFPSVSCVGWHRAPSHFCNDFRDGLCKYRFTLASPSSVLLKG